MVELTDLKQTVMWDNDQIDWHSWTKCSMVVPVLSLQASNARGPLPAVGGSYYVRTVLAINFPALCHLFGNDFTARQLESAWLNMPLVKRSKPNRGTTSSFRNKRKWADDASSNRGGIRSSVPSVGGHWHPQGVEKKHQHK